MRRLYAFTTRVGMFYIAEHDGRFHPLYRDESLGSYSQPSQAADDLAGGHTFSAGGGIDTSHLGIPADLTEWDRLF